MQQPKLPFLETLYHLRTIEQIILYNKIDTVTADEEKEIIDFLEAEYEREVIDYPFLSPKFNPKAALWGAKTLYFSSQLLLHRENKAEQLEDIILPYTASINASAMLSADLCLRFLPQIVQQLQLINFNDSLIGILKQKLQQFHYSAIGFDLDNASIDLQLLFSDKCFKQLYLDRITQYRAIQWTSIPIVKQSILENLGNHKTHFWRELSLDNKLI